MGDITQNYNFGNNNQISSNTAAEKKINSITDSNPPTTTTILTNTVSTRFYDSSFTLQKKVDVLEPKLDVKYKESIEQQNQIHSFNDKLKDESKAELKLILKIQTLHVKLQQFESISEIKYKKMQKMN